ncbi:uncharacterized protein LOC110933686 [Helianthus annuus]|uniref:uncharacterized protein LOC110933686 n=1 Tax=Helianthus annuus TaxID=4232 RepID=UPI001652EF58|nr:uncharacterized protein LOC110933686 [Helianthus annuus]
MNIMSLNSRGVGLRAKAEWVRRLCVQQQLSLIMLQETLNSNLDGEVLERFWGRGDFQFEWVGFVGRSGGVLTVWDPAVFTLLEVKKFANCLLVSGIIKGSGVMSHYLNVYAPKNQVEKRNLWSEISSIIGVGDGFWTVAGDFNSVRLVSDRRNSKFSLSTAQEFNGFIDDANLHEYSLKGRRFTYVVGDKMSRIAKIFANWNFFMDWPNAEYLALAREELDHCYSLASKSNGTN